MSYSISVKFNSEKEQVEMFEFLNSQKELIQNLSDLRFGLMDHNLNYNVELGNKQGESIGYAPKEDFLLGFQGTSIRSYLWYLCAWMAVKSGSKNKDNKNNPYFYYDDEIMDIAFNERNKGDTVVTKEGLPLIHVNRVKNTNIFISSIKKILNLNEQVDEFELLMKQLNENWIEFQKKKNRELKP